MFVASIIIAIAAIGSAFMIEACARGRIRINPIAGIRIPSVMLSEGAWKAGHRASLPAVWIGAVVAAAIALISLTPNVLDMDRGTLITAAAVVLVVALVIGSFLAHRAALNQFAREYPKEKHPSAH